MKLHLIRCTGLVVLGLAGAGPAVCQQTSATVNTAPAAGETSITEEQAQAAVAAVTQQSLGDLLPKEIPVGPDMDAPYADVPPAFEKAVRLIAVDNFTSATPELLAMYNKAEGNDKARAAMWLGIAYGTQALNYPNSGWEQGTSASTYLREAMQIDPRVIQAPDACRIMAEMVAHGWGNEDPATALKRAEEKAEETRRPMDFYFAGVISQRLSARAWGYSDTSEQDKKTLSLYAKSLARDPGRYETWSAYLPSLFPVGMHDLATTEAKKMYDHFKNLRTPLLNDQGPAVLYVNSSSYRTMAGDAAHFDAVGKQWPDAPVAPFEMAMRAIESTPTLAMEMFPQMLADFESGKLKPRPREAGYYVSALYKYAFLLQDKGETEKSIEYYKKVRDLSPSYAEVNMNIGILYTRLSEKETTGLKKLALLEEALRYVQEQEKWDYRGKAALKANEARMRLRSTIYRMKLEMRDKEKAGAQAGDKPTTTSTPQ